MYPVNTVTARPLLQLLCALDGREAGTLVLVSTWARFIEFIALPASTPEDHISFQADVERDNAYISLLTIRLSRQLADDVAPTGPMTRATFAEFQFGNVPSDLDSVALWAEDFATLEDFRSAVEDSPQYIWAAAQPPLDSAIGVDDVQAGQDAG